LTVNKPSVAENRGVGIWLQRKRVAGRKKGAYEETDRRVFVKKKSQVKREEERLEGSREPSPQLEL